MKRHLFRRRIALMTVAAIGASGAVVAIAPLASATVSGCSATLRYADADTNNRTEYATSRCATVNGGNSQRAILYVNVGSTNYGPWVYTSGVDSATDKHRYGRSAGYATR